MYTSGLQKCPEPALQSLTELHTTCGYPAANLRHGWGRQYGHPNGEFSAITWERRLLVFSSGLCRIMTMAFYLIRRHLPAVPRTAWEGTASRITCCPATASLRSRNRFIFDGIPTRQIGPVFPSLIMSSHVLLNKPTDLPCNLRARRTANAVLSCLRLLQLLSY